ncbi:MAG: hypothetical protein ACFFF4_01320 [Candidatus Thorarchaeota archaeon]
MTEKGTERAARVADLMQLVARLLVLVIIIPAAILLAVFYLLTGIIPDDIIRGMFSLTFGLGLAGVFVARMKHPIVGSVMVAFAALSGATSLAIFWSSLITTTILIHIYFIILFGIFKYLYRVNVIPPWRWTWIRGISGLTIVLSAPFGCAIFLFSLGLQISHVLAYSLLVLWVYSVGTHYYFKDTRLGIPNSFLPSLAITLIVTQNHLNILPTSAITLTVSVGLMSFGIGLLVMSQILRFVQRSLSFRPMRREEEKMRKAKLLRVVGMDNYAENIEESVKPDPEWIIRIQTAHVLSAVSMLIIAIGFPSYFMWVSFLTPWGIEPSFNFLFTPIAFLLTLMILVPSPVLFRIGGRIKRTRMTFIMKGIGGIIVADAVLISILWTQFLLWSISSTLFVAFVLGLTGATGVFERVRLYWKLLGQFLISSLKRIRLWISTHQLYSAIFVDLSTTVSFLFTLYPILNSMPNPVLSIVSVGGLVFSTFGLLGIATLDRVIRRKMFVALWSSFLVSLSSLTLWHLVSNLMMEPIDGMPYALVWFVGLAGLQRVDVSRRFISLPFGIAVLGIVYKVISFELQIAARTFPLLSISATVILLGLILHQEYLQMYNTASRLLVAAGRRIYAGAARVYHAIAGAISRFISSAKRVLVRVGGLIYRGFVFLGVQLLRFIVIIYAAFIILGIGNIGFGMLFITGGYDPFFVLFSMTLSFFILMSPSLLFRERHKTPMMQVIIAGLSITLAGFIFYYNISLHLGIRIPLALAASLLILTAGRSWLPERFRIGLPIASWLSLYSAGVFYLYLLILSNSPVYALPVALFVFGIGFLPLQTVDSLRRIAAGLYLILSVPTGTIITYITTSNFLLFGFVLIVLPAIVLHKQYAITIRMIGAGLVKLGGYIARGISFAGRMIAMFLAIHIIGASAIFSMILSFILVQFSLSTLQTIIYPDFMSVLVFLLIALISWTPFVRIRKSDHEDLFSGILVMIIGAIGGITFLFTLSNGILQSLLFTTSLTAFLGALAIPQIQRIKTRLHAIVISIASFMFLCLDILALDIITNVGISTFCLTLLAAPFISASNRIRIVYPVTTLALVGMIFYYLFVPMMDIMMSISLFVAIEAILLMLPHSTRSWQAWWAFSIASGYAVYAISAAFPSIRIIAAIFVAIELVRQTPDIEYRFLEYQEVLDIFRAAIISYIAWVFFSPIVSITLAIEICLTVFLAITTVSLWNVSSTRVQVGLVDSFALTLSLLSITNFLFVLQLELMISIYISVLPILIALTYGAYTGIARSAHWTILRSLITVLIGLVWFGAYRSLDSLILCVETGLVVALAITLQAPWGIENKRNITLALNGSVILLLESIWIWHALLVFFLPANIILVGCSGLLASVAIFLATDTVDWYKFESLWEIVSFSVGFTLGSFFAGWNFVQEYLPTNLPLVAGWCLTTYSLVSVPITLYGEMTRGLQAREKVAHMAWLPAVLGVSLIAYSFASLNGYDLLNTVFTTGISFSVSFLLFANLHPSPSTRLKVAVNMSFSLCMALLVFIIYGWGDPVWSIGLPLMVWYMFSLPVLMQPTYLVLIKTYNAVVSVLTRLSNFLLAGLTRIYNGLVAGLTRIYSALLANRENIALGFPVVLGVWFGGTFFLNDAYPAILGYNLRNCFQGVAIAAMAMGGMYFIEAWTMNGNVSSRVKGPSIALLGRGLFVLLLSIYLPELASDYIQILYYFLGALSVSFFVIFMLNLAFGRNKEWRRSLLFTGLTLLPSLTIGLIIFQNQSIINALLIAGVVSTLVEAPIIESQLRAFFGALRAIGAWIVRGLYRLGAAIKAFFIRFGYINWIVFSIGFSCGLSWLSYPFFSELLGMTPGGILYIIPNIGIPILMLGILLLSVSVIRRTYKSSFGTVSIIISLLGGAFTGSSWLFDHGLMVESVVTAIIITCLSGLALLRESQLHKKWVSVLWVPIPLSVAIFVFSILYPVESATQLLPLAISVSGLVGLLLLLLSTYSRLLPDMAKSSLWILTSITSASATFSVSISIGFPLLASIYLSVFVMSWVLFPVTLKQYRYLFLAPLFFSLTGFAFTFVFGEYYQGLLLALSSFLLFIVLFIKEREIRNPKLAYLRLAILLILLGSLAIFGLSMVGVFAPTI